MSWLAWPSVYWYECNLFAKFKVLNLGLVTKGFRERRYIPGRTESLGSDGSSPVRAKHLLITWFRSTRLSVSFCNCQSALPRVVVCFKCGPLGKEGVSDKCQRKRRKAWRYGDGL